MCEESFFKIYFMSSLEYFKSLLHTTNSSEFYILNRTRIVWFLMSTNGIILYFERNGECIGFIIMYTHMYSVPKISG